MQIIIVSDYSEQVATLRTLALETLVSRAEGFTHPAAALDWCMDHEPDLVFVDYTMRACDGLEFLRRFRAMPHLQGVPVVLMLPEGYGAIKAAAWKLGVTDFLSNPVDRIEFIARARNLLLLRYTRTVAAHPGAQDQAAAENALLTGTGDWRDPMQPSGMLGQLH
jgi:putative two-component system response regulator